MPLHISVEELLFASLLLVDACELEVADYVHHYWIRRVKSSIWVSAAGTLMLLLSPLIHAILAEQLVLT